MKKEIFNYLFILLGSIAYGLGTVLFVFPAKLLMGGTNGIAVILSGLLPLSTGTFSVILNTSLIVLAFFVLGRDMAIKTLVGSALTTVSIGLFENLFSTVPPVVSNGLLCAILGGVIIAIASGVMFFVGSSSGGTDIVALIVKKYSKMNIGTALLVVDVLIVVVGGILAGWDIFLYSVVGLLIKTLGINVVIDIIKKFRTKGKENQ